VSKSDSYGPKGPYHGALLLSRSRRIPSTFSAARDAINCIGTYPRAVFAGKDPSRALAMSSVKKEDVSSEWRDLPDKEKKVLDDWMTFFSKRYNVVGQLVGAEM